MCRKYGFLSIHFLNVQSFLTSFLLAIIYDDKGVSKMEVYVELTYCMNGILFIMTYEMISLLLNINWSFLKILFLSFLSNISVILIYIDYLPYISFLYWFVLFLFFFLINHLTHVHSMVWIN